MTTWCLGILRAGDSLASLEAESKVPWKDIVRANGANPDIRSSVDGWVTSTGGRINANGWAVFVEGQKIMLPCGLRPAPPGAKPVTPGIGASSMGSLLPWLVGGGIIAALSRRGSKKRKNSKRRR